MTKRIRLGLFGLIAAVALFFAGLFTAALPVQKAKAADNTALTITGLREESGIADHADGNLYSLYFNTNITGIDSSICWNVWDNSAKLYINGTEEYTGDATWSSDGVLFLQDVISTDVTVETITIKAGTTYTINSVVYEISADYTVYNYDGDLHTEAKPETSENTMVTITGVGACDASAGTINITTDIDGATAWKFCDTFPFLYNGAEKQIPFGWVTSKVMQTQGFTGWTEGDVLEIVEGTTFSVNTVDTVYEIAQGYKLTYSGGSWTGEAVVETTTMTLSGLTQNAKFTGSRYELYINVDVTATTTWTWDNNASVVLNGTSTKADGFCFSESKVLYVQVSTTEVADPLTIAKGTQLTIGGTVYEIAEDFNIYYYDGALHTSAYVPPVSVSLTALRGTSGAEVRAEGDGMLYKLYFDTDMMVSEDFWTGWENGVSVLVNETLSVTGNACWSDSTGLYVQIVTAETVESLTVSEGTQMTINGTLYEVENTFKVYYYDGMLSATEKVEEHTYTEIEIKEIILSGSNLFIYTEDSYGYNDWSTLNHGDLTVTYCGETIAPLKLTNTDKCMIIQGLSIDLSSFEASEDYPYPTIKFSAGDAWNYVIEPAIRLLEDVTFYYYEGAWITTIPTLNEVDYDSVDNAQSSSSVIMLVVDGNLGIEAKTGIAALATQITVNGYNLAKDGADCSVLVMDENVLRIDLGKTLYFENEAYERMTVVIPAGASDYVGANGFVFKNDITLYYRKDVALWVTTIDTTAPVITYEGALSLTATEGDNAPTITATATDETDGTLETVITYSKGALSNGKLLAGTHTITITAVDAQKNEAESVVITITVSEKPANDTSSDADDSQSGEAGDGSSSEQDGQTPDSTEEKGCGNTVGAIGLFSILAGAAVLCFKKREE